MFDAYRRFLDHVKHHPERFTFSNPRSVIEAEAPAAREMLDVNRRAAAP
jgi:hypothetical protein